MPDAASPGDLIPRLYLAAQGAEDWTDVIADAARRYGGSSGLLYDCNPAVGQTQIVGIHNLDPDAVMAYERHYNQVDLWHQRAQSRPIGRVYGTDSMVSDAELLRSEFYCDHLRRQDLFYGSGATVRRSSHQIVLFGIQRSRRMGPFAERDLHALQTLVPHVRKAMAMQRRLRRVQRPQDHLSALLEQSSSCALLVDAGLRLHYANTAAESLIENADGLEMRAGSLSAAGDADTRQLRRAVRRATGLADGVAAGDTVALRRPGQQPLHLLVVPVSGRDQPGLACIFINMPRDDGISGLARRYNLTPAETRVLAGLVRGLALADIAEIHGVSQNTLRIQLRRVFAKTDTHRQAQLIQLAFAHGISSS